MRILVTGGAGFIGSNLVHHLLASHPEDSVTVLDVLSYAGKRASLASVEGNPRFRFVQGDICDQALVQELVAEHDAVAHLAAESHVDRSISDPGAFVRSNVQGTQILLDAFRLHGQGRFLHVSTDEVYGSLGPTGLFSEESPLAPNSPYAASKAASDLLVRAYFHTYGLALISTRCSNNYGPYQFPEKLFPFFITECLREAPLPVYGDGQQVRDWLHVQDHVEALDLVLRQGRPGEVYNIGGNNERTNLEITHAILQAMGRPPGAIRHVQDRPGHDRRYAIDASKIRRELGWSPRIPFTEGLASTIQWYLQRRDWWEPLQARGLDPSRARANALPSGSGLLSPQPTSEVGLP